MSCQVSKEPLDREDGIYAGRKKLTERLERLGLKEQEMGDDGNCQFRALSHQLYRSQRYHGTIRAKAVEQIQHHHTELYDCYFDGPMDLEKYLTSMVLPRPPSPCTIPPPPSPDCATAPPPIDLCCCTPTPKPHPFVLLPYIPLCHSPPLLPWYYCLPTPLTSLWHCPPPPTCGAESWS